jgi:hypothetical protein
LAGTGCTGPAPARKVVVVVVVVVVEAVLWPQHVPRSRPRLAQQDQAHGGSKEKKQGSEMAVKTPEEAAVRSVSLQPQSRHQRSQAGTAGSTCRPKEMELREEIVGSPHVGEVCSVMTRAVRNGCPSRRYAHR